MTDRTDTDAEQRDHTTPTPTPIPTIAQVNAELHAIAVRGRDVAALLERITALANARPLAADWATQAAALRAQAQREYQRIAADLHALDMHIRALPTATGERQAVIARFAARRLWPLPTLAHLLGPVAARALAWGWGGDGSTGSTGRSTAADGIGGR